MSDPVIPEDAEMDSMIQEAFMEWLASVSDVTTGVPV